MGQRLVVTVIKNNEEIAKLYYHWGAYTVSALCESAGIIECLLDKENDISDLRLRLIRFVESNGGCIQGGKDSEEFEAISKMYPGQKFKEDGSRNYGLIAITQAGMTSLQDWSEGDLYIDLDTETINNDIFCAYSLEDYMDYYGETNNINSIPESDINIETFKFEDIDDIISDLDKLHSYEFRRGEWIYQLIA
jgi:hypothetical protein